MDISIVTISFTQIGDITSCWYNCFDPIKGSHAHIAIIDILDYLDKHYGSLSSQDIFSLNAYNSEISLSANFVTWDTVYATYASYFAVVSIEETIQWKYILAG